MREKLVKIAVTGPESTGKSLLSARLAERFRTVFVPEFAREYIDALDRPYVESDILAIAKGQMDSERRMEPRAKNFLFCDTELIVTKIWSEVRYGRCDPWILEAIERNRYDLFLLCDIDLPWEPDPQREHPHMRKYLFDLYFNELASRGFPFAVIGGSGNDRLENAVSAMRDHRLLNP